MRFKLNIDKTKDELVEATLHGKGDFSYRLEELVLGANNAVRHDGLHIKIKSARRVVFLKIVAEADYRLFKDRVVENSR